MDYVNAAIKSAAFWAAVLGFANALVAWLAPGAPAEVVAAGNVFFGAVFFIVMSVPIKGNVAETRSLRARGIKPK